MLPSEGEWIMTVSAFFDESGKFKDHKVISMGCVAAFARQVDDFSHDWGRLLHASGVKDLSAKNVFNSNRQFSAKNPALGVKKRVESLLPFIGCIRKNLQVVSGCAVDVAAFKEL